MLLSHLAKANVIFLFSSFFLLFISFLFPFLFLFLFPFLFLLISPSAPSLYIYFIYRLGEWM